MPAPRPTATGIEIPDRIAEEILADYPTLTLESILAALRFAAQAVNERELPLRLSA